MKRFYGGDSRATLLGVLLVAVVVVVVLQTNPMEQLVPLPAQPEDDSNLKRSSRNSQGGDWFLEKEQDEIEKYAPDPPTSPPAGYSTRAPVDVDKLFGKLATGDDEFPEERILELMKANMSYSPCEQFEPSQLRQAYVNIVPNFHDTSKDQEIAERQGRRQKAMHDSCNRKKPQRLAQSQRTNVFNHLLVDDKYKMIYCYVPKVGCSNWKRVFKVLAERDPWPGCYPLSHVRDVNLMTEYSREEKLIRLKTYFKFVFVREPLARLLSAYIDKFHPNGTDRTYYKYYGKYIVRKYRKNHKPLFKGNDVTWPEFIQYVMGLRRSQFNEHWSRYEDLCQPCIVNYDFIGHYENMNDEANFVLRQAHADSRVAYPSRQSFYHTSTASKVRGTFSGLNATVRRRIMEIYAESYDMFQYDKPDWMSYGNDDNDDTDGL